MKEYIMLGVSNWLIEMYGHRCDEYEQTCVICQKWRCFDVLFGDREDDE